jgi:hypothetical protein
MRQLVHFSTRLSTRRPIVPTRLLAALTNACRAFVPQPHTYRPELHYMRGPGPKSREKRPKDGQSRRFIATC